MTVEKYFLVQLLFCPILNFFKELKIRVTEKFWKCIRMSIYYKAAFYVYTVNTFATYVTARARRPR